MEYLVDPAADGLWDSVAIIATKTGTDRREPRTDEQWKAVRAHALILAEASNLLIMGSRKAAPAGTVAGEGELTPADIDRRIAANRIAFEEFAVNLRNTARKAMRAIDEKDSRGLFAVGGEIDVACEACHAVFWYPEQSTPKRTQ